jgi:hypothetical protein
VNGVLILMPNEVAATLNKDLAWGVSVIDNSMRLWWGISAYNGALVLSGMI